MVEKKSPFPATQDYRMEKGQLDHCPNNEHKINPITLDSRNLVVVLCLVDAVVSE